MRRGKGEGGERMRLALAKPGLRRTAKSAVSSKPPKSPNLGLLESGLQVIQPTKQA